MNAHAGTTRTDKRYLNSFDLIRLIAALAVLYGHHFVLTGRVEPDVSGFTTLGGLAVTVFFVASGYFVAGSWDSEPRAGRFWLKRSLRLFPALVVVVFATVFVIGPIQTSLPVREYFASAVTWEYWKNAVLVFGIQYNLPGVFAENTSSAVNGSLWTLPVELFMYFVVFSIGFVFRAFARWVYAGLAVVFAVCFYLVFRSGEFPVYFHLPVFQTLDLGVFFFIGATLRGFRATIRLSPFWAILGALLAFLMIGQGGFATRLVMWLTIPPLVLAAGFQQSRAGTWIASKGDISYGVYLWAFPIQQVVIERVFPSIGFWPSMVCAVMLTMAVAAGSWVFVERPALGLKQRTPRGTRTARAFEVAAESTNRLEQR